jgi:hypothetical protein
MTTSFEQGAALAASTFDPWAWLCALTEAGGGYALASGRKLWLVVDHVPADALTPIMAALVGHPDRQEAVRSTIERRQIGELAA